MKTRRTGIHFKQLFAYLLLVSLFITPFSSVDSFAEAIEIPFRYLYRGFTPVSLADTGKRAAFSTVSSGGAWLIKEEETLFTFCNNFCPGVPFYEEYDFSRDYMLAHVCFGAKPSYNVAQNVDVVTLENDYLDMQFSNDYTSYIYALNKDVANYYVTIVIVSLEDIPENLANPVNIDKGVTEERLEIEAITNRFAEAYFTGDTYTIGTYLVSPYQHNSHDVFSEGGEVSSEKTIKGLEAVGDEQVGTRKTVWVEFKTSKYPDMYIYLRIDFIKQEDGWKVDFYGLEI